MAMMSIEKQTPPSEKNQVTEWTMWCANLYSFIKARQKEDSITSLQISFRHDNQDYTLTFKPSTHAQRGVGDFTVSCTDTAESLQKATMFHIGAFLTSKFKGAVITGLEINGRSSELEELGFQMDGKIDIRSHEDFLSTGNSYVGGHLARVLDDFKSDPWFSKHLSESGLNLPRIIIGEEPMSLVLLKNILEHIATDKQYDMGDQVFLGESYRVLLKTLSNEDQEEILGG